MAKFTRVATPARQNSPPEFQQIVKAWRSLLAPNK